MDSTPHPTQTLDFIWKFVDKLVYLGNSQKLPFVISPNLKSKFLSSKRVKNVPQVLKQVVYLSCYLWNTGLESTLVVPPPTSTHPSKSPPKNEQNKNSLEHVGKFPFKTTP